MQRFSNKFLRLSTINHTVAFNLGRRDGFVTCFKCKDTGITSAMYSVSQIGDLPNFICLVNAAFCLSDVKWHRTGRHLLLSRDNSSGVFIYMEKVKVSK